MEKKISPPKRAVGSKAIQDPIPKRFLRSKQAQEYLNVGHDKFWSLVKSNAFPKSNPHGQLVYFLVEDLDAFILSGFPK